MNIYFDKIFLLSDEYQEILIDNNSFSQQKYIELSLRKQNINGIQYEDVFLLESGCYYKISLKEKVEDIKKFTLNTDLLKSGLLFNGFSDNMKSIFLFNPTVNNIFIKSDTIIGDTK